MSTLQDFYAEEHLDTSDGFGSMEGRDNPHRGFDVLRHSIGTPVPSLYDGTVVRAGWYSGILGNVVSVTRADGVTFSYCHLSAVLVSAGQGVTQGVIVGNLGATGKVTGPHTHVAVNPAGAGNDPGTSAVVDPLPYIRAARDGDQGPAGGGENSSEVDQWGDTWALQNSQEPGAPWWPVGPTMERVQRALAGKGRYDGKIDGTGGELTAKGIQETLNVSGRNGGVLVENGTSTTPLDALLGRNNAYGIQEYARDFGGDEAYTGPQDGDPRHFSWVGFAKGLELP